MIDISQIHNYVHFKTSYDEVVQGIVQCRKASGQTQGDVAEWIEVDRRRIIDFEKKNKVDIEILCILSDKFGIDLSLTFK